LVKGTANYRNKKSPKEIRSHSNQASDITS